MHLLFTLDIEISFKSGNSVQVNGQELENLASTPVQYPTFTIRKAGIFAIVHGKHFQLKWDFGEIKIIA